MHVNMIQLLRLIRWRNIAFVAFVMYALRHFVARPLLAENGYAIRRESLVEDRGFLYPVLEAGAGEMRLSPGHCHCGPFVTGDPLGERYIIQRIIQLQGIVAGRNRSSRPEDRADDVRDLLTELLELREEWRHANGTGN